MRRNVGSLDRAVRIVLGLVLAAAGVLALAGYWTAGVVVGAVALAVGGILIVTGTTQKCPLYAGTGIDTSGERR